MTMPDPPDGDDILALLEEVHQERLTAYLGRAWPDGPHVSARGSAEYLEHMREDVIRETPPEVNS